MRGAWACSRTDERESVVARTTPASRVHLLRPGGRDATTVLISVVAVSTPADRNVCDLDLFNCSRWRPVLHGGPIHACCCSSLPPLPNLHAARDRQNYGREKTKTQNDCEIQNSMPDVNIVGIIAVCLADFGKAAAPAAAAAALAKCQA